MPLTADDEILDPTTDDAAPQVAAPPPRTDRGNMADPAYRLWFRSRAKDYIARRGQGIADTEFETRWPGEAAFMQAGEPDFTPNPKAAPYAGTAGPEPQAQPVQPPKAQTPATPDLGQDYREPDRPPAPPQADPLVAAVHARRAALGGAPVDPLVAAVHARRQVLSLPPGVAAPAAPGSYPGAQQVIAAMQQKRQAQIAAEVDANMRPQTGPPGPELQYDPTAAGQGIRETPEAQANPTGFIAGLKRGFVQSTGDTAMRPLVSDQTRERYELTKPETGAAAAVGSFVGGLPSAVVPGVSPGHNLGVLAGGVNPGTIVKGASPALVSALGSVGDRIAQTAGPRAAAAFTHATEVGGVMGSQAMVEQAASENDKWLSDPGGAAYRTIAAGFKGAATGAAMGGAMGSLHGGGGNLPPTDGRTPEGGEQGVTFADNHVPIAVNDDSSAVENAGKQKDNAATIPQKRGGGLAMDNPPVIRDAAEAEANGVSQPTPPAADTAASPEEATPASTSLRPAANPSQEKPSSAQIRAESGVPATSENQGTRPPSRPAEEDVSEPLPQSTSRPSAQDTTPQEKAHKFSSTQFDLSPEASDKVKAIGARIPDVDLAADGREDNPHVTVKYGLHGEDPEAVQPVPEGVGGPISDFDAAKVADELPGPTSARKAMTADDREAMGLDTLASPDRHSWEQAIADAKRKKIPDKAMSIAAAVNAKPRALDDTETAGLVTAATSIKNMHRDAMDVIGRSSDPSEITFKSAEAARLEQDFDTLTQALKTSGTEKGRALAAQKLTLNKDFDLISVKNRAKAAKGGELSTVESGRFEDLTRQLKERNERVADLERQMKEQTAERQVRQHKARDRADPALRQREFADLLGKARELLKAGC